MRIKLTNKFKGYYIGYNGGGNPAYIWHKSIEPNRILKKFTTQEKRRMLRKMP